MPFLSDWRRCTADDLRGLQRADFAWEFLRRNPDYRDDYDKTMQRIAAAEVDSEAARAALARRWGLRFRRRPKPLLS